MSVAPRRVPIARLVGLFGVRGEFKVRETPAGAGVLEAGGTYALDAEGAGATVTVSQVRRHHERPILALEGVDTPEAARAFLGRDLFVERAAIDLGPGEYLDDDLIGLDLVDESGAVLARVVGVEHYPAQDCLIVEPGRALVPMVGAFVRSIDLRARRIVTSLPLGLLDSQAAVIDVDTPPPRDSRARRSSK